MNKGAAAAAALVILIPLWSTARAETESDRLDAFFEEVFQRDLDRAPQTRASLGLGGGKDRWNDISEAHRVETAALQRADLERLAAFDFDALSPEAQLSYELFAFDARSNLAMFEWRRNVYKISHRRGLHRIIPQTLIDNHAIETAQDGRDYIARLRGVKPLLEQLVVELERDEAAGVLAPRFDIEKVLDTARNLIVGAPFDETGRANAVWADFAGKIETAKLSARERRKLLAEGRAAMREGFGPGFAYLVAWLEGALDRAGDEAGVWRLPEGEAFYAAMLERETTMPVTADDVHRIGLAEVARIHAEMRDLMRETGFSGSLKAFFAFLREDPQFYYETSDEGRAAYIAEMQAAIDEIDARLPELFNRLPKAPMIIKRVEPWMERTAGTAGYFAPSADGARPGIVYVNLYDMRRMPRYEISALAYHEGVPGHHLENAISQELDGLPRFRNFRGYTAFSEGWGLYAEQIPKEIGLYTDPYQDFGRLSMDLMRAGRLVVDSGLHAKRWTREQAVAWLDENTPVAHAGNVVAVDRYITLPGQAASYAIGKLKMMALRERARAALGPRFNLADFHDAVLGSGPLPLPLLERNIERWIASHDVE